MNPFEMVVIIVALAILGGVIKFYLEHRLDRQAHLDNSERASLEARLAQVETRLQTLERIVTSDAWELKKQFRDLENDKENP